MKRSKEGCLNIVVQSWVLSMMFLFASHVQALGLGEIQVQSRLGELLNAKIPLMVPEVESLSGIKVRLASPERYKENLLRFPHGVQFKFRIKERENNTPVVQIATQQTIQDLFLDVMVEVESSRGKLIRSYTFLLDPPLTGTNLPVVSETPPSFSKSLRPKRLTKKDVVSRKLIQPIKKPHRVKTHRKSDVVVPSESRMTKGLIGKFKSTPHGKLALTLSTELSISKSNLNQGASSATDRQDALQEDLIAREKTLDELHLQISEMQEIIGTLQTELLSRPSASVTSNAVLKTASVQKTIDNRSTFISRYWPELVGFFSLLLVACGVYLYRRRREDHEHWDVFEDMGNVEAESVPASPGFEPTPIIEPEIGAQSIKIPAYVDPDSSPTVPPEYDLLEEADIYLRFGHEKLAEEVLTEAIAINPSNPHGYITLLGIFETRGDVDAYNQLAPRLREVADDSDWKNIAVAGARLDPENDLYTDGGRLNYP